MSQLDREDYRIPDFWKREIRKKEGNNTIHRKPETCRCPLCARYDFVFPINITACPRCTERVIGYKAEAKVVVSGTFTMKPCFYCGARSTLMKRIHTRSCKKCIGVIARMKKV